MTKLLIWLKGFVESGPPQSTARLIAIGCFIVGAVKAFQAHPDSVIIGEFIVSGAVAIAIHMLGPGGGP